MLNQHISKIAIIGSGIMGSGIACHFANIGVQVLLLDIIPKSLNDIEKKKGLSLDDKITELALSDENFPDFEDGLQYYSAIENDIEIIITRNTIKLNK